MADNDRRRFIGQVTLGAIGATIMPDTNAAGRTNRGWVFASRPQGLPTQDNFRFEERPLAELKDGEVLLRTVFMSLDPYMRGRMNAGASYTAGYELGEYMGGGTVSQVEESRNDKFRPGDLVLAYSGWQAYEISSGEGLTILDPRIDPPSHALGVLGMPGLTAYVGLLDIGEPKPGETVVVGAATGAVGSVVGQIARLKGCRVVGVAGAQRKLEYAVDKLGFDYCVSHRDPSLAENLAAACPDGIDVYFENVGGATWDAVMPLLNDFARIPVCGLIAHYNQKGLPPGPDRMIALQSMILVKRLKMQGFIVSDRWDRMGEFVRDVGAWVAQGDIKTTETVVEGLENAPEAFLTLFDGSKMGKLIVKVSDVR